MFDSDIGIILFSDSGSGTGIPSSIRPALGDFTNSVNNIFLEFHGSHMNHKF